MPLHAAPATIDTHKTQLESTQLQIKSAEHNRMQTAKKLAAARRASAALQQTIIDKAADIDRIERVILKQQRDIVALQKDEQRITADLATRRTHMGRLVSAAWSLQHRPQLAAWMLPEKTRERALTARGLHVTTISLQQQMQDMQHMLQRQQALRTDIAQQQEKNRTHIDELENERASLRQDLVKRQAIVADIQQLQHRHMEKIASLTRSAADTQQLIIRLERDRTQELAARYDNIAPTSKPDYRYRPAPLARNDASNAQKRTATSFTQAKGSLPLPANGRIAGRYGARRGPNDRLKGVEIATIPGATVTAPYEGEILFTGKFLDYGNMVIVRHNDDYHTLVAGLDRIDVARGQFLLDGEPIGAMGDTKESQTLYLELRRKSQAVNPHPWFAALSRDHAHY